VSDHQCGCAFADFWNVFCIIASLYCWPLLAHRSSVAVSAALLWRACLGLDHLCVTDNDAKSVWQSLWAKELFLPSSIMVSISSIRSSTDLVMRCHSNKSNQIIDLTIRNDLPVWYNMA